MKMKLLLTTVFAIMLFAVAGNAQQKLIMFDSHSTDYAMSPSRTAAPMIDALAGKPIKVVIHFAKMSKATPKLFLAGAPGMTFKAVPCEPDGRVAARESVEKMEVYLEIRLQNALVSNYSVSGQPGSCGLLGLRLSNGAEYFAKLRFVGGR
jgi:type VI protein secretion system component Hcp